MRVLCTAVLLFVVACCCSSRVEAAEPLLRIYSAGDGSAGFVDELGRQRVFHGVNGVQKAFPWLWPDFWPMNITRVKELQSWGVNVVRLGWMWSGFQPAAPTNTSSGFNATYAEATRQIITTLADHGIYTLLDMHQDGMSELFCLYNGLPLWLVKGFRTPPKHAFPWPLNATAADCQLFWEDYFFTEAMEQAYQDLYDAGSNPMQSYLKAFWAKSAAQFAGNPNILGMEVINEPWAGNVFQNPALILPGVAGKKNLMPMYNNVAEAIRDADPDRIVFFEPVTWGAYLHAPPAFAGSGFTAPPNGAHYANVSAFSYHYYCPLYHGSSDKDPALTQALCQGVQDVMFGSAVFDAQQMQTASMLTEWGEVDPRSKWGFKQWDAVLTGTERAAATPQSWTWWGYCGHECYNPDGSAIPAYASNLARTYARAIAGTSQFVRFNVTTGHFSMCYALPSPAADGGGRNDLRLTTEVFFSRELQYPSGPVVTTTPNVQATVGNDTVLVVPATSGFVTGERACVNVTRAAADARLDAPRW